MQSSVLPAGNLQHLIGAINNASTGYDTNTAPAATVQKFQIMGACKALLGALADPQDLVGMHYGNVSLKCSERTISFYTDMDFLDDGSRSHSYAA